MKHGYSFIIREVHMIDSTTQSAKKVTMCFFRSFLEFFLSSQLAKFHKLAHVLDCLLIQNGISPWQFAQAAELHLARGDALSKGLPRKVLPFL